MDGPAAGASDVRLDMLTSESEPRTSVRIDRGRSPRPFEEFFRAEFPRLLVLARALCGQAAADDVAQEAMLAAYRHWSQIEGYDSPEAWVRRVCVRRATSLVRTRAAEARALLRLHARPTETESVQLDPRHDVFWAEVRTLPKRQAQAAALRYVYSMSVAEVAAVMDCSQGTVKSHLSRARTTLSQRLGLDGGEAS